MEIKDEYQDVFVVGARELVFTNTKIDGYETETFQDLKYEVVVKGTDSYFVLTFQTEHGMCGSGYCTASYGVVEVEEVKFEEIGSLHYTPRGCNHWSINLARPSDVSIDDKLAYFSELGGCQYYPTGHFAFHKDGWWDTGRRPEKPMKHIFHGAPALGKSTLASLLRDKVVVDGDVFSDQLHLLHVLEDTEWDIAVVSLKYQVDLAWLKERLSDDYTIVMVEFS